MELAVANDSNGVTVADTLLGAEFNATLVHQVVTAYMAGGRAGTKAQKSRADVRGGGKKPWRQKGTGRARAGTIRSPIWSGGGVTFAARPRDFSQKVNRKMYRGAMRAIFSELNRQERLLVVSELALEERKTRGLLDKLGSVGAGSRGLIIVKEVDDKLAYSANNLPGLVVSDVSGLDPVALVRAEQVVVTVDALKQIEEWLA
jgi:large subunit ribosomal protein L4